MTRPVLPRPEPNSSDDPTTAPLTVGAPAGDVKELRLGLVCYGGVSLAIYMHGITKEIHRAVRASALEERSQPSDEDAKSEHAYRGLLQSLRKERDVHTRIVVDAIAGSSAGGINGIFLAKALAHDLNQDSLRDLWFDHGDLGRIINEPKGFGGWVQERLAKLVPLGGKNAVPNDEAREKLLVAALHVYAQPLLDGDEMSRRIYEALGGMEPGEDAQAARAASLVPDRHLLELFVTVTDYSGYPRRLPIADPRIVSERQHRHLLEFRYRSDQSNDFSAKENGALALATRATSSLPAGFQPVHVGTFPGVLKGATSSQGLERFFRAYVLAEAKPGWAQLMDGGILDNKPFGPVLGAIRQRPAASEVDRYLVFLEPDRSPPLRRRRNAGPEPDCRCTGRTDRPPAERADPRRVARSAQAKRVRPHRARHDRSQLDSGRRAGAQARRRFRGRAGAGRRGAEGSERPHSHGLEDTDGARVPI